MIRAWENSWDEFVPFLEFPAELRRVVYTTNAVESLNARFRRAVRHRGHFPRGRVCRERLCENGSRRESAAAGGPMGAGDSAVVVHLPRCRPMLSPRTESRTDSWSQDGVRTPGQRPRPKCGHPQGLPEGLRGPVNEIGTVRLHSSG